MNMNTATSLSLDLDSFGLNLDFRKGDAEFSSEMRNLRSQLTEPLNRSVSEAGSQMNTPVPKVAKIREKNRIAQQRYRNRVRVSPLKQFMVMSRL